jgi:hypothetical protein
MHENTGTVGLESPVISSEFGLSEFALSVLDGVFIAGFQIAGIIFRFTLGCSTRDAA